MLTMKDEIKKYGYSLLSKQDYSIYDFKNKLIKKFVNNTSQQKQNANDKIIYIHNDLCIENEIDEIIQDFIAKDFLNDYNYAKNYIELHNYGRKKIEFILRSKGIDSTVFSELLDSNNENQIEEIKKQWNKIGDKPSDKKIASLLRKGFEYKNIKLALESIDD